MIKTITYTTLFVVSGLIILGVAVTWITFVLSNFSEKHDNVLNWSPFKMPTSVAIKGFWTTPAVLFCGTFGIALILLHSRMRNDVVLS